jgi:uncharacterized protein YaiI (UPF0178 family)
MPAGAGACRAAGEADGVEARDNRSRRRYASRMIYVDADACPVREEVLRVAERHGQAVVYVSNGGIRPSRHPLATVVVVDSGADAADRWIAERIGPGDLCVTADVPLAARCVERGARALAPDGSPLTERTVGERLAMRDLMADLRAADPFRAGGGRPFGPADRARFKQALERLLSAGS